MTIDAAYTAPVADPMHTMLENALQPYLSGELPATDALIDRLFEVIAHADRDSSLITTLYNAIKGMTPSHELIEPMYKAIGAAYEFNAAPVSTGTPTLSPTQVAVRNRKGGPRDGSLGEQILTDMRENPGTPYKIGTLAKMYGGPARQGAVGAAMKALVEKGLAVPVTLTGERAIHYLLADDPAAPEQIPGTAPEHTDPAPQTTETPATPDTAPAADTAPDTAETAPEADASKPPARRGPAKK
jgi:hypothetical protein